MQEYIIIIVSLSSRALQAQYKAKANSAEQRLMKLQPCLRRRFLSSRATDGQVATCLQPQFCIASFTRVLILPNVLCCSSIKLTHEECSSEKLFLVPDFSEQAEKLGGTSSRTAAG